MTKKLPFDDNSFDCVFSCGVFEYFNDAQIIGILKEANRVCKKKVIIMAPNAYSLAYRIGMRYLQNTNNWQWGGERPFYTLKPQFRKAGFKNIEEFSVGSKHSLSFLRMPHGKHIQGIIIKMLNLKDHSKPSLLRQGYLLISVGEKSI